MVLLGITGQFLLRHLEHSSWTFVHIPLWCYLEKRVGSKRVKIRRKKRGQYSYLNAVEGTEQRSFDTLRKLRTITSPHLCIESPAWVQSTGRGDSKSQGPDMGPSYEEQCPLTWMIVFFLSYKSTHKQAKLMHLFLSPFSKLFISQIPTATKKSLPWSSITQWLCKLVDAWDWHRL